jgi:hypothetical protein
MARINPKSMTMLAGAATGLAGEGAVDGLQELLKASIPNGRWWVPPAYTQTTGDEAVQFDSASKMIAARVTPQTDVAVLAVSLYITAVAAEGQGDITLYIYNDVSNEPGSSLATLGTVSSGDSADVWVRLVATAYQLMRDRIYWLVGKGSASADFSLSIRRPNTATGSAMPDEMNLCLVSTDGGSSWTQATQNGLPAMWNVVVNSVADKHVPQLCYGRFTGKYSYIPDADMVEIPQEGILLDCSGLTDDTEYYLYEYESGGELAVEASTTIPILSDGIKVKTGETAKRYTGGVVARALISTHQGPIDVSDSRLVDNEYNRVPRTLAKFNPFSGDTLETVTADSQWRSWNGDGDDFAVRLLLQSPRAFLMGAHISLIYTSVCYVSVGLDTKTPYHTAMSRGQAGGMGTLQVPITMPAGTHTMWPIVMAPSGTPQAYYYYSSTPFALFSGMTTM